MMITSDWHIHSEHSCDQACMPVSALIPGAAAAGITDYGLTDHVHTPFNLPDLEASRAAYLAADPGPGFHFGVELSCVSAWELRELATGTHEAPVYGIRRGGPADADLALGVDAEALRRLGVEYVVAGTHWPMYVPYTRAAIIRDYHRQNMFLATHPLVDIVAHPWWWMGHWQDDNGTYPAEPWFDDFGCIPQSMHEEFAAALVQHGTVAEANISATLLNPRYPAAFGPRYADYLADLKSRGVRISIGSDCHAATYAIDFERAWNLLEAAGFRSDDIWCLEAATLKPPG